MRAIGPRFLGCCLLVVLLLAGGGCLTERDRALLQQRPRNRVFTPGDAPQLPEDRKALLAEYDRGEGQGIYVVRLAPDAALQKRYHVNHDMVLVVSEGSAIVKVEATRYFLEPGSAVLLPRLTAYSVLPHETETDVVVLLVFSPPFDGEDVVLEE